MDLDRSSFVSTLRRTFHLLARAASCRFDTGVPHVDADPSMAEADLADAVEGDDWALGSGIKLPRLGVEEPIVRRLLDLPERVAALVIEAAVLERVGVDKEWRCVSQLVRTEMLILGELVPLLEVLPFSIWVEAILDHGVTTEGVSFERVGMEGAERRGIMWRHGERQGEEVKPEALRFKPGSGESRHQSRSVQSRVLKLLTKVSLSPPESLNQNSSSSCIARAISSATRFSPPRARLSTSICPVSACHALAGVQCRLPRRRQIGLAAVSRSTRKSINR